MAWLAVLRPESQSVRKSGLVSGQVSELHPKASVGNQPEQIRLYRHALLDNPNDERDLGRDQLDWR